MISIFSAALGNGEKPWDWQVTTKLGDQPIRPPDYYYTNEKMNVSWIITPSSSVNVERLSLKITGGNITYPKNQSENLSFSMQLSGTNQIIIGNKTIPLEMINIPRSKNAERLNLELAAKAMKGKSPQNESHSIEFLVNISGALTITKFHDKNGNGKKDPNEPGIPGWKFTINGTDIRGKPYTNIATTSNDGMVELNLTPGTYSITEESRPDWILTTNPPFEVVLDAGRNYPVAFGNIQKATLNILKYKDENRNGQHDAGEQGLENWNFDVKEINSNKRIDIITTNNEGLASIRLRPGNYTVTENINLKWNSSTPVEQVVSLGTGETKSIHFGNYPRDARLSIIKFHDLNRNGQQDPNEPGIPGWRINIAGKDYLNQNYTSRLVTDNNGISVPQTLVLKPGTYTIAEETKTEWIATTPIKQTITLGPDDRRTVSFGNDINDSILEITKLRAVNESGKLIPSGGIGGWKFDISGRDYLNQNYTNSVMTGNYGISTLRIKPGTYRVNEEMKLNWISITPEEQTVTLNPGEVKKLPFINYLNQTLSVYKFNDTNKNGIPDPGEKGVPGWNFSIDDSSGVVTTRTTDSNGQVQINIKPNTKYTITEYLKLGWEPTTATQQTQTTDSETPEFSMIFGNSPPLPTIIINKFEDANKNGTRDFDEQGLIGWEFDVTGPFYSPVNKTTRVTTDENGNAVYICPAPGLYIVKEIMKSGCWINTTNDTVSVQMPAGQTRYAEFGNYEVCHVNYANALQNRDIEVQKFVDPSQLAADMISDCRDIYLNYTIQIRPREIANATDLVIAINEMVPATKESQRTMDTVVNGVAGFLDEQPMNSNSSSRVGLIRWIGSESNEIYPNNNYTDLRNRVKESQFIQTNIASNFADWTFGIIDNFYRVSQPDAMKLLVLITDSESPINRPIETLDSNYTIHAIAIGGKETDTTRLLRNLTSEHHGKLYLANNSAEMLEALTELAWVTRPTTLTGMQLTDTLPSYLEPVDYQVNPPESRNITENNDGRDWHTTTMKWWIGNLSSSGRPWNTSFTVRFCWIVPADIHQMDASPRISQVNYIREDGSKAAIQVPEGAISIRKSAPSPSKPTPGFEIFISIAGLLVYLYTLKKR